MSTFIIQKFAVYHIYGVQENPNVKVFATYGQSAIRPRPTTDHYRDSHFSCESKSVRSELFVGFFSIMTISSFVHRSIQSTRVKSVFGIINASLHSVAQEDDRLFHLLHFSTLRHDLRNGTNLTLPFCRFAYCKL